MAAPTRLVRRRRTGDRTIVLRAWPAPDCVPIFCQPAERVTEAARRATVLGMSSFPTSEILRLTPTSSTAERMDALRAFAQQWHGVTILGSVPESRAEELPTPLVAAHRLVRRVPHAIVQNKLVALDQL